MTLRPTHGARFELMLETPGDAAHYRIDVLTATTQFTAAATLDRAGVRITWEQDPPKWMADTTLGLLRTLHKNHLDARDWPSRLHRWREER